ncbi:fungal hydrophobin [Heliocybe sulcata]|uniref:Hydrophobin n=1 Tax=Heliocybe sulcata TaxID=5364 RepID=A0A5C3N2X1_9AGAM|nr:fungal hydrophobin [Heliocybe sulcata]
MFSFTKLAAIAAVATLAVATPTPGGQPAEPAGNCNTGPVQCCNSVQSASDPVVSTLAGLLGIVLPDANAMVGLTCSPITVIGAAGGASCSAHPVCCENNSYGSLISTGCVPVTL